VAGTRSKRRGGVEVELHLHNLDINRRWADVRQHTHCLGQDTNQGLHEHEPAGPHLTTRFDSRERYSVKYSGNYAGT
jgi:hypothetical protein